jgi:hypothetical protein
MRSSWAGPGSFWEDAIKLRGCIYCVFIMLRAIPVSEPRNAGSSELGAVLPVWAWKEPAFVQSHYE